LKPSGSLCGEHRPVGAGLLRAAFRRLRSDGQRRCRL